MAALKFLQGVASVGMKGISKANKYFKDRAEKRRYEKGQKEYERITNAVAAKRRKEKAEAEIAEYDKKFNITDKDRQDPDYKQFVKNIHNKYKPKKYFD